jgi:hypothetical protein
MKKLSVFSLGLALVGGAASAQTYDELPAGGYTQLVEQYYDYMLVPSTNYIPLHLQYAYDVNDIPVAAANITELTWRRNNYWGNSLPAGSITWTVTVGHGPNDPPNMSSTYANNLGPLSKVVFQGTVNFPAANNSGPTPAPWTHVLKLTTPFQFIKPSGKSLIVDIVTTAVTGYINSTYTIAAAAPDAGLRFENGGAQSTCKFSNGKYNSSLGYNLSGLNNNGGTWYVQYGSLLPNAPGLATLSGYGMDNKGPWPLPIDLTFLGAPGCQWRVGMELGFWVPVVADANGNARWPNITIPPGFGGVNLYDHAFFLDAQANAAGIVVTWTSKWHIGTLKGPSANMLYTLQDSNSSPTGNFRPGYGTHLRITR